MEGAWCVSEVGGGGERGGLGLGHVGVGLEQKRWVARTFGPKDGREKEKGFGIYENG